jgi:hypothetical protein
MPNRAEDLAFAEDSGRRALDFERKTVRSGSLGRTGTAVFFPASVRTISTYNWTKAGSSYQAIEKSEKRGGSRKTLKAGEFTAQDAEIAEEDHRSRI